MAEKLAQILYLDDSPGFVDIYQQVLQECGYRTFVVTDSNEALDMLRDNEIDLFYIDEAMSWETLRNLTLMSPLILIIHLCVLINLTHEHSRWA